MTRCWSSRRIPSRPGQKMSMLYLKSQVNPHFLYNNLPPESRVRQCKDMMFNQLNKLNMVDAAELKSYINRIVDDMDKAQIAAMEKAPLGYAKKIKEKIESLLDAHYRETFAKWLETERIV